jgi:hypothetical protein
VLHTWGSTSAYDRARWRHLARRLSLGVAPPPLPARPRHEVALSRMATQIVRPR